MLLSYSLWASVAALALWSLYYLLTRYAPVSLLSKLRLPSHLSSYSSGNGNASYLPLPVSFAEQVRDGFTSTLFDVQAENVQGADARQGLDQRGLEEVRTIMRRERKTFDEARLIRQQRIFGRNGIDPMTGMPLDAKAVTRL